jgi:hypothetical protein
MAMFIGPYIIIILDVDRLLLQRFLLVTLFEFPKDNLQCLRFERYLGKALRFCKAFSQQQTSPLRQ